MRLETLYQSVVNAVSNAKDGKINDLRIPNRDEIRERIIAAQKAYKQKKQNLDIGRLDIEDIVEMLNDPKAHAQGETKPRKPRKKGIIYKDADGQFVDRQGNPLQVVIGEPPQQVANTENAGQ